MTVSSESQRLEEPYLPWKFHLGEGPHWEASSGTFRCVDIIRKQIHTINPKEGPSSHKIIQLEDSVGVTADIEGTDDEFVCGAKRGYAVFNKKSGQLSYIKKFWDDPAMEERMRANDGAVDSKGRFWMGTMNDFHVGEPQPEGVLFRLDPDLTLHRMMEGVMIPNGIGWSPDDTTMYFIDSPSKSVFAFDFDAEKGTMSNKRVLWKVEDEGQVPDGLTIDAEGFLWVAIHEGSRVVRLSPSGEEVSQIRLDAWKITCPVFGGPNLTDLWITTAGVGDGEKGPENSDHHGCLFRTKISTKGMPANKFVLFR